MIVMWLFLSMPWVCCVALPHDAMGLSAICDCVLPDHAHLLCVGICNSYLNIGHVVGMFYEWPDCFYLGGIGANRNVSGKLGMKLAITLSIVSICIQ